MTHDDIYDYLNKHSIGVVSTIDVNINGQPESAVVGFGQTHELEIIFRTSKKTRKYRNLYANPHIAFVIGWDHGQTLQYEGMARELLAAEMDIVEEHYFKKHGIGEHYMPY
jgi:nitroimidazol reductase NimA-like FMN-containing flavoprotein (pyridoxamine 5'-phosphate oxidase superfamily)